MDSVLARIAGVCLSFGLSTLPAQAATLLHSYDFSTDASDSVGSLNGSLIGAATVSGGVLDLPSAGSYVELSGFAIPNSNFSISLRAKGGAQSGYSEFISQNFSGGGIYIGTNPSNGIRLGDQISVTAVAFLDDNVFHDYTLTTDGTGTLFYIDGSLVGSYATMISETASGTVTRFGQQFAPDTEQFIGQLDKIRIYAGALTADEVAFGGTPVPEPISLVLLATGLAALTTLRRRAK